MRKKILISVLIIIIAVIVFFIFRERIVPVNIYYDDNEIFSLALREGEEEPNYIKWMSFDVPEEVMTQALKYDIELHGSETPLDWVELIAYSAAENWGEFEKNKKSSAIDDIVERVKGGENFHETASELKLYEFYYETYSAVLGEMAGYFEVEEDGEVSTKYGIKAYSPIAQGYHYNHYDDFGVSRTYGYKRKHLGNDLMGSTGTPIIAVEDGTVEALGWNQYGGWRIGIRSLDNKRYYYYAHLRKDHPYVYTLKEGDRVKAGDCIGYLGMTGYSATENVNNIKIPHLHFGMEIIFDESQKDGYNQIWVDAYEIVKFLSKNKMPVVYDDKTKDFYRTINTNSILTE